MPGKIVLITGANRGIGFAIVQATATKDSQNTYIIGVRSLESGDEAIKQLRSLGISAKLDSIKLNVTRDEDIQAAASSIKAKYGRLDILVNNAGVGLIPKADLSDYRASFNATFDANITSVGLLTTTFLPLLKAASSPRVLNVSSARGSVARVTGSVNPPTASICYSISKTALNMLTFEMAKLEPGITYYVTSPGHTKTAFNGYRGTKDPLDGAKVIQELILANDGDFKAGFWEFEDGEMREVPW